MVSVRFAAVTISIRAHSPTVNKQSAKLLSIVKSVAFLTLLQEADAAAKAAEEQAAQEEASRQKQIQDSYNAVVPDEIQRKVQDALEKEMVRPQLSQARHLPVCIDIVLTMTLKYKLTATAVQRLLETNWKCVLAQYRFKCTCNFGASYLLLCGDHGSALQEHLQVIMAGQFAKQEAALKSKVAELEAKVAGSGVT